MIDPDADSHSEARAFTPSGLARPRWLRGALLTLGFVCLGIGVVGIVLPGLPGTVFLILAAWCFTRSSPRFEAWLLAHPRLGPPVRQWREGGAIPRRAKWFACLSMATSWLILLATEAPAYVKLGVPLILVAVAGYIVTRPDGGPGV